MITEKRPMEPEKLQRILEAGRLAPTALCSNATRFVVVDDPELMKKVQAACMGPGAAGQGADGGSGLLGQHPEYGLRPAGFHRGLLHCSELYDAGCC